MLTDAPPRKNRAEYSESDRIKTLDLPPNGDLSDIAQRLECAMKADKIRDVRTACAQFLAIASDFYESPELRHPRISRETSSHTRAWDFRAFHYDPETSLIRVWMRTAVRKEVTSLGTFVSTLCHEFCHHLDFQKFEFRDSSHRRGFYERAALYHHARGTPLKKLFWVPMTGGRWRIDRQRTNRGA